MLFANVHTCVYGRFHDLGICKENHESLSLGDLIEDVVAIIQILTVAFVLLSRRICST